VMVLTGYSKKPPFGHFLAKFFSPKWLIRGIFMRKIDCAHQKTLKTPPRPWNIQFSYFQVEIPTEKYEGWILPELGGSFKGFQCIQSISRIKLPIMSHFGKKNFWKIFAKKWRNGGFLEHPVLISYPQLFASPASS
jgi:hypothetical protein